MRKWIVRACAAGVLLAVTMAGPAMAAPPRAADGAPVNDPWLTAERSDRLHEISDAKDKAIGLESKLAEGTPSVLRQSPTRGKGAAKSSSVGVQCVSPPGVYGYIAYRAANYRQERSYWCGPASARQSLSLNKAWSGSSASLPSQATLAARMGTTTSGSSTARMASALNAYSGTFGWVYYVASNLTDTADPLGAFYHRIGSMIRGRYTCPVILTATQYIPRYRGHVSRHYMSVCGIDDRTAPVKMRSVDPNSNSAYLGVFWDPVGCTYSQGLFKACWEADRAGSNMAMAW